MVIKQIPGNISTEHDVTLGPKQRHMHDPHTPKQDDAKDHSLDRVTLSKDYGRICTADEAGIEDCCRHRVS